MPSQLGKGLDQAVGALGKEYGGEYIEGVTHWRGKKMVSFSEWQDLAKHHYAFQYGAEHLDMEKALSHIPIEFVKYPFPFHLRTFSEKYEKQYQQWLKDYNELLEFLNIPDRSVDTWR